MSKRIPIEFYNHLRAVREAKDRAHVELTRFAPHTDARRAAARRYLAALNAYATAISFRDILEREQLNQEER